MHILLHTTIVHANATIACSWSTILATQSCVLCPFNAISRFVYSINVIIHSCQGCTKLITIYHSCQGCLIHSFQGCIKLITIYHSCQGCHKPSHALHCFAMSIYDAISRFPSMLRYLTLCITTRFTSINNQLHKVCLITVDRP